MKIALSSESTIDLPREVLEELNMPIVHFHIEMAGTSYYDNEITLEKMYEYTEKTGKMCHTSAPNVGEIRAQFDRLLEDNDAIIHFTISSKLSSSYSNAVIAADGDPRIRVIDSKGTNGNMSLLALYAKEMIDGGYDLDEIHEAILKRVPYDRCSMQLETLEYLQKGGRCSKLASLAANILRIKPEIDCDEEGAFTVGKKRRGPAKKVIPEYIDDLLARYPNKDLKAATVSVSTVSDDLIEVVKKKLEKAGFQRIIFSQACPTNAYHAGPGVLGVQFLFDGPHPVEKKAL